MNESVQVLRFEIDGSWTVDDMALAFLHQRDLYNLRLAIQLCFEEVRDWEMFYEELRHFPPFRMRRRRLMVPPIQSMMYPAIPTIPLDGRELARLSQFSYPQNPFSVRRMQYGSPGFKDLAGLGEIVGHLKDFLVKIIDVVSTKRQRELENQEREVRIERMRIENAREFVGLARECGYSEGDLRQFVSWVDNRQETFIQLVRTGKIRSVKLLTDTDSSEG